MPLRAQSVLQEKFHLNSTKYSGFIKESLGGTQSQGVEIHTDLLQSNNFPALQNALIIWPLLGCSQNLN